MKLRDVHLVSHPLFRKADFGNRIRSGLTVRLGKNHQKPSESVNAVHSVEYTLVRPDLNDPLARGRLDWQVYPTLVPTEVEDEIRRK
ncbi:hypothetical protein A4G29_15340 [Mycobacterium kansasii]|nr:hypothetical protein A4G29_15340 [Mycobacterium kansasii]